MGIACGVNSVSKRFLKKVLHLVSSLIYIIFIANTPIPLEKFTAD
jgi:hypothetical protein